MQKEEQIRKNEKWAKNKDKRDWERKKKEKLENKEIKQEKR